MRFGCAILITLVTNAVSAGAHADSLGEVRATIDAQLAGLGGVVMREDISRYVSTGGKVHKLDDFETRVELADGADRFGELKRNGRPMPAVPDIPGAWSYGEFSTLLRISREALDEPAVHLTELPGGELLRAKFSYPASSRKWFVSVHSHLYWLAFQGEVMISRATGAVVAISWISESPDGVPDILQVRRTVRFAPTRAGGRILMLPEYAEYRVVHAGNRVEWNAANFLRAERYGSVVSMKFDGDE